jgi:hypothetical protein
LEITFTLRFCKVNGKFRYSWEDPYDGYQYKEVQAGYNDADFVYDPKLRDDSKDQIIMESQYDVDGTPAEWVKGSKQQGFMNGSLYLGKGSEVCELNSDRGNESEVVENRNKAFNLGYEYREDQVTQSAATAQSSKATPSPRLTPAEEDEQALRDAMSAKTMFVSLTRRLGKVDPLAKTGGSG